MEKQSISNIKSKLYQRKANFIKDEKEGIKNYGKAIKVSIGKERKTYKEILPDERKHLSKIKQI